MAATTAQEDQRGGGGGGTSYRRRSRRWRVRARWLRLGIGLLAVVIGCVALAIGLSNRPPRQPYRTPAVAEALARANLAPPVHDVTSLSAVPRLAQPGLRLGEAKLTLDVSRPAAAPLLPAVLVDVLPPSPPPVGRDEPLLPPPLAVEEEEPPPAPPAVVTTPEPRPALPVPALAPRTALEQPPIQPAAAIVARPRLRSSDGPRLAIVIDDLGYDVRAAQRAIALPAGVTLAFLPYGYQLDRLTADAVARGHDVFLHLPMEPIGSEDPGPNALLTSLEPPEIGRRLAWAFERVPRAVGVNNHMGSRATADPAMMLAVLTEVRRRGLFFVDSRTTPVSVAGGIAERLGLPHAARDVFLDNEPTEAAVRTQLAAAERVARQRGQALAIGHPFPATLAVLEAWLPEAERRGVRLVSARELGVRGEGTPCALASAAAAPC